MRRMKMFKKTVCVIVIITFLINEAAFALSPGLLSGGSDGSLRPNARDVQSDMHAAGQKLFAANRGPGAIDFDKRPAEFTGKVPALEGVRVITADYDKPPADWMSLPKTGKPHPILLKTDIVEAAQYFLEKEACLPADAFKVREDYYELEKASDGELPLSRWEYDSRTGTWTLVIHTDFARMWNDIRKHDVWLEDTDMTGRVRVVSVAWGVFYRVMKHEMGDLEKASGEVKSYGHFTRIGRDGAVVKINKIPAEADMLANMIGGYYGFANDAIWMWFLGSYCFGRSTQYDNDILKDRLLWFFGLYKGKGDAELNRWAVEHNLPDEFPRLHDGAARERAVNLAQIINHAYFSRPAVAGENYGGNPADRQAGILALADALSDYENDPDARARADALFHEYVRRAVCYLILHRGISPRSRTEIDTVKPRWSRDGRIALPAETDGFLRETAISIAQKASSDTKTRLWSTLQDARKDFAAAAQIARDYIGSASDTRTVEDMARDAEMAYYGERILLVSVYFRDLIAARNRQAELKARYAGRKPFITEALPATGTGGGAQGAAAAPQKKIFLHRKAAGPAEGPAAFDTAKMMDTKRYADILRVQTGLFEAMTGNSPAKARRAEHRLRTIDADIRRHPNRVEYMKQAEAQDFAPAMRDFISGEGLVREIWWVKVTISADGKSRKCGYHNPRGDLVFETKGTLSSEGESALPAWKDAGPVVSIPHEYGRLKKLYAAGLVKLEETVVAEPAVSARPAKPGSSDLGKPAHEYRRVPEEGIGRPGPETAFYRSGHEALAARLAEISCSISESLKENTDAARIIVRTDLAGLRTIAKNLRSAGYYGFTASQEFRKLPADAAKRFVDARVAALKAKSRVRAGLALVSGAILMIALQIPGGVVVLAAALAAVGYGWFEVIMENTVRAKTYGWPTTMDSIRNRQPSRAEPAQSASSKPEAPNLEAPEAESPAPKVTVREDIGLAIKHVESLHDTVAASQVQVSGGTPGGSPFAGLIDEFTERLFGNAALMVPTAICLAIPADIPDLKNIIHVLEAKIHGYKETCGDASVIVRTLSSIKAVIARKVDALSGAAAGPSILGSSNEPAGLLRTIEAGIDEVLKAHGKDFKDVYSDEAQAAIGELIMFDDTRRAAGLAYSDYRSHLHILYARLYGRGDIKYVYKFFDELKARRDELPELYKRIMGSKYFLRTYIIAALMDAEYIRASLAERKHIFSCAMERLTGDENAVERLIPDTDEFHSFMAEAAKQVLALSVLYADNGEYDRAFTLIDNLLAASGFIFTLAIESGNEYIKDAIQGDIDAYLARRAALQHRRGLRPRIAVAAGKHVIGYAKERALNGLAASIGLDGDTVIRNSWKYSIEALPAEGGQRSRYLVYDGDLAGCLVEGPDGKRAWERVEVAAEAPPAVKGGAAKPEAANLATDAALGIVGSPAAAGDNRVQEIETRIFGIGKAHGKSFRDYLSDEAQASFDEVIAIDDSRRSAGLALANFRLYYTILMARLFGRGDYRYVYRFFDELKSRRAELPDLYRNVMGQKFFLHIYSTAALMDPEYVRASVAARKTVGMFAMERLTGDENAMSGVLSGPDEIIWFAKEGVRQVLFLSMSYADKGRFDKACVLLDNLIMESQAIIEEAHDAGEEAISGMLQKDVDSYLERRGAFQHRRDLRPRIAVAEGRRIVGDTKAPVLEALAASLGLDGDTVIRNSWKYSIEALPAEGGQRSRYLVYDGDLAGCLVEGPDGKRTWKRVEVAAEAPPAVKGGAAKPEAADLSSAESDAAIEAGASIPMLSAYDKGLLMHRTVLVRGDLNVSDETGRIKSDKRIRELIPTLAYLVKNGATVILASHNGRPGGKIKPELSMGPVAGRLAQLLGEQGAGVEVNFLEGSVTEQGLAGGVRDRIKPGAVNVLENTRYFKGEEKNDPAFAEALAGLAGNDVYLFDAFGTAERVHGSTGGAASHMKTILLGFLMEKEFRYLQGALDALYGLVIGGGPKMSEKLPIVKNVIRNIRKGGFLILGSGPSPAFLKNIYNIDLAHKPSEQDLKDAAEMSRLAAEAGTRVVLPVDFIMTDRDLTAEVEGGKNSIDLKRLPPGAKIYRLTLDQLKAGRFTDESGREAPVSGLYLYGTGSATEALFRDMITGAGKGDAVFYNGTVSVEEIAEFASGSKALCAALAEATGRGVITVIGGGDTTKSAEKNRVDKLVTHCSTGGGASAAFLKGEKLAVIAELERIIGRRKKAEDAAVRKAELARSVGSLDVYVRPAIEGIVSRLRELGIEPVVDRTDGADSTTIAYALVHNTADENDPLTIKIFYGPGVRPHLLIQRIGAGVKVETDLHMMDSVCLKETVLSSLEQVIQSGWFAQNYMPRAPAGNAKPASSDLAAKPNVPISVKAVILAAVKECFSPLKLLNFISRRRIERARADDLKWRAVDLLIGKRKLFEYGQPRHSSMTYMQYLVRAYDLSGRYGPHADRTYSAGHQGENMECYKDVMGVIDEVLRDMGLPVSRDEGGLVDISAIGGVKTLELARIAGEYCVRIVPSLADKAASRTAFIKPLNGHSLKSVALSEESLDEAVGARVRAILKVSPKSAFLKAVVPLWQLYRIRRLKAPDVDFSDAWRFADGVFAVDFKDGLILLDKGGRISVFTRWEADAIYALEGRVSHVVRNFDDETAIRDYREHQKAVDRPIAAAIGRGDYRMDNTYWSYHVDDAVQEKLYKALKPAGARDRIAYGLEYYYVKVGQRLPELSVGSVYDRRGTVSVRSHSARYENRERVYILLTNEEWARLIDPDRQNYNFIIEKGNDGLVADIKAAIVHERGVRLGLQVLGFRNGRPVNELDRFNDAISAHGAAVDLSAYRTLKKIIESPAPEANLSGLSFTNAAGERVLRDLAGGAGKPASSDLEATQGLSAEEKELLYDVAMTDEMEPLTRIRAVEALLVKGVSPEAREGLLAKLAEIAEKNTDYQARIFACEALLSKWAGDVPNRETHLAFLRRMALETDIKYDLKALATAGMIALGLEREKLVPAAVELMKNQRAHILCRVENARALVKAGLDGSGEHAKLLGGVVTGEVTLRIRLEAAAACLESSVNEAAAVAFMRDKLATGALWVKSMAFAALTKRAALGAAVQAAPKPASSDLGLNFNPKATGRLDGAALHTFATDPDTTVDDLAAYIINGHNTDQIHLIRLALQIRGALSAIESLDYKLASAGIVRPETMPRRKPGSSDLGASGAILAATRAYSDARPMHRNLSPAYGYNDQRYMIQDRWIPKSQGAAVQEIDEEQLLELALTRPGWKVVVAENYDMMTYAALYVSVNMMHMAGREFAIGLATGGTTESLRKAMGLLSHSEEILGGISVPGDKVNKWSTLDNYYWPRSAPDIDVALSSYTQEQQYMVLNNIYGGVGCGYFVTPLDKTSLGLGETAEDFRMRMRIFLDDAYRILMQLHGIGSDGHDAFNEIYAYLALLRRDYGSVQLDITRVQNIGHFLPEGFHPFFLRFMADNYIFSVERLLGVLEALGYENVKEYYPEAKYRFKSEGEYASALVYLTENFRLTPPQSITQGTGDILERTGNPDSLNLILASNYHKATPLHDAVELDPGRWNTASGLQLYANSLVITDLDSAARGTKKLDLSKCFFFVPQGAGRTLCTSAGIETLWCATPEGRRIMRLLEAKHGKPASSDLGSNAASATKPEAANIMVPWDAHELADHVGRYIGGMKYAVPGTGKTITYALDDGTPAKVLEVIEKASAGQSAGCVRRIEERVLGNIAVMARLCLVWEHAPIMLGAKTDEAREKMLRELVLRYATDDEASRFVEDNLGEEAYGRLMNDPGLFAKASLIYDYYLDKGAGGTAIKEGILRLFDGAYPDAYFKRLKTALRPKSREYRNAGWSTFFDNKQFNPNCVGDRRTCSPAAYIRYAFREGLTSVEIPADFLPFDPDKRLPGEIGPAERARIKALAGLYGVTLTVHSPLVGPQHPKTNFKYLFEDPADNVAIFKETVDLCEDIGAKVLVVHLSDHKNPAAYADIVEHAGGKGVRIGFENYCDKSGRFPSLKEHTKALNAVIAELIRRGSGESVKNLALLIDVAHLNLVATGLDPVVAVSYLRTLVGLWEKEVRRLIRPGNAVGEVHLNNNIGPIYFYKELGLFSADAHGRVEDEGSIYNEAVLAILTAMGFNTFFAVAETKYRATRDGSMLIARGMQRTPSFEDMVGRGGEIISDRKRQNAAEYEKFENILEDESGEIHYAYRYIAARWGIKDLLRHLGQRTMHGLMSVTQMEKKPEAIIASLKCGREPVKVKKGDAIINEKDTGDTMYIITKGRLGIFKSVAGIEKPVLENARPVERIAGDFVGEIALLDPHHRRTATVRAAEDSEVVAVQAYEFWTMCARSPVLREFVNIIAGKRRQVTADFAQNAAPVAGPKPASSDLGSNAAPGTATEDYLVRLVEAAAQEKLTLDSRLEGRTGEWLGDGNREAVRKEGDKLIANADADIREALADVKDAPMLMRVEAALRARLEDANKNAAAAMQASLGRREPGKPVLVPPSPLESYFGLYADMVAKRASEIEAGGLQAFKGIARRHEGDSIGRTALSLIEDVPGPEASHLRIVWATAMQRLGYLRKKVGQGEPVSAGLLKRVAADLNSPVFKVYYGFEEEVRTLLSLAGEINQAVNGKPASSDLGAPSAREVRGAEWTREALVRYLEKFAGRLRNNMRLDSAAAIDTLAAVVAQRILTPAQRTFALTSLALLRPAIEGLKQFWGAGDVEIALAHLDAHVRHLNDISGAQEAAPASGSPEAKAPALKYKPAAEFIKSLALEPGASLFPERHEGLGRTSPETVRFKAGKKTDSFCLSFSHYTNLPFTMNFPAPAAPAGDFLLSVGTPNRSKALFELFMQTGAGLFLNTRGRARAGEQGDRKFSAEDASHRIANDSDAIIGFDMPAPRKLVVYAKEEIVDIIAKTEGRTEFTVRPSPGTKVEISFVPVPSERRVSFARYVLTGDRLETGRALEASLRGVFPRGNRNLAAKMLGAANPIATIDVYSRNGRPEVAVLHRANIESYMGYYTPCYRLLLDQGRLYVNYTGFGGEIHATSIGSRQDILRMVQSVIGGKAAVAAALPIEVPQAGQYRVLSDEAIEGVNTMRFPRGANVAVLETRRDASLAAIGITRERLAGYCKRVEALSPDLFTGEALANRLAALNPSIVAVPDMMDLSAKARALRRAAAKLPGVKAFIFYLTPQALKDEFNLLIPYDGPAEDFKESVLKEGYKSQNVRINYALFANMSGRIWTRIFPQLKSRGWIGAECYKWRVIDDGDIAPTLPGTYVMAGKGADMRGLKTIAPPENATFIDLGSHPDDEIITRLSSNILFNRAAGNNARVMLFSVSHMTAVPEIDGLPISQQEKLRMKWDLRLAEIEKVKVLTGLKIEPVFRTWRASDGMTPYERRKATGKAVFLPEEIAHIKVRISGILYWHKRKKRSEVWIGLPHGDDTHPDHVLLNRELTAMLREISRKLHMRINVIYSPQASFYAGNLYSFFANQKEKGGILRQAAVAQDADTALKLDRAYSEVSLEASSGHPGSVPPRVGDYRERMKMLSAADAVKLIEEEDGVSRPAAGKPEAANLEAPSEAPAHNAPPSAAEIFVNAFSVSDLMHLVMLYEGDDLYKHVMKGDIDENSLAASCMKALEKLEFLLKSNGFFVKRGWLDRDRRPKLNLAGGLAALKEALAARKESEAAGHAAKVAEAAAKKSEQLKPGTSDLPSASGTAVTEPLIKVIYEYFAHAAKNKGPGRTEPYEDEIAAFYPVFGDLNRTAVEIYLPQAMSNSITAEVSREIAGLNKRIRARTGMTGDAISLKPYDSRNLEVKLAQKAPGVRRIFVNDMTMAADLRELAEKRPSVFAGNRLITMSVPAGRTVEESSVNQAWLVKVAILSAMADESNTGTVGAALRAELEGRISVRVDDFVSNLVRAENELTPDASVAARVNFFLGAVVRLSQFIADQIRILKAFWTAA
jgi:3-phosphoglycerate kinase/CRP-like cAMP-binding protein/sugar phosphate isomerase/epimerase